ncbi:MAG: M28 family peptidase [Cyclobacteriaceae bacterium]
MKKIIYSLTILIGVSALAQDKQAVKYAKTIKSEDLKEHLTILASDEYEGRETGTKGQKMAAEYIANQFKNLGLEGPVEGSYLQKFNLASSSISASYFRKGDEKKVVFEDFVYFSRSETAGEEYIKIIIADAEDSKIKTYKDAYVAYPVDSYTNLQERMDKAIEAGAKGFIEIIEPIEEFNTTLKRYSAFMQRPGLELGGRDNEGSKMIIVGKEVIAWIFEKGYDQLMPGDEAEIVFSADYLDKPIWTENVLGFLKGSEKPEEIVVITAHYDHIGITNGEINNGADDDGSGTVTVLEIAEAFTAAAAKNKGPKRSILFMTVTGEEKGLLGSRYYTDFDPVFPLANTVANLNIDMVGRVDEKHEGNPDYIYLIGSDKLSQELHDLSENVNKTYSNLELDYTYNDESDPNRFYYRSDHYNFAKNNIPIIFYFNGVHADYHKPTDTIEKINFEKIEKIARLVFHTGWEIANREERIKVD